MCKRLEFKLDTLYKEKDNVEPNLIDIEIHNLYYEHIDIKSRINIILYLYEKFSERLGKIYLNRLLRSLVKDRFNIYYFNPDYKILFTEERLKKDVYKYFNKLEYITNKRLEFQHSKDIGRGMTRSICRIECCGELFESDYLNKWQKKNN